MNVRLKNATGGNITVDIEASDTPIQIIGKAIDQCGDKAAIIMRDPNEFSNLRGRGTETIQATESLFAVDGKTGNRPLEFDLPIQEQVVQEFNEAKAQGRTLEFVVAVALIVG